MKKLIIMAILATAALTSCTKQNETVKPAPMPGKVIVRCDHCTFYVTWNKVTTQHSVDGSGYFDILNYEAGKYLFIDIQQNVDASVTVFDPKGNIASRMNLAAYPGADDTKLAFQLSIPLK